MGQAKRRKLLDPNYGKVWSHKPTVGFEVRGSIPPEKLYKQLLQILPRDGRKQLVIANLSQKHHFKKCCDQIGNDVFGFEFSFEDLMDDLIDDHFVLLMSINQDVIPPRI